MRIDPAAARLAAIGDNRIGERNVGGGGFLLSCGGEFRRKTFEVEPVFTCAPQSLDYGCGFDAGRAAAPPERGETPRAIKGGNRLALAPTQEPERIGTAETRLKRGFERRIDRRQRLYLRRAWCANARRRGGGVLDPPLPSTGKIALFRQPGGAFL